MEITRENESTYVLCSLGGARLNYFNCPGYQPVCPIIK
jgi:hypothetical protein